MRVLGLTAWHVRIPLRRQIRHASHTRTETDSIVVRCRLSDGSIGWGEGLPRPYVTGETIVSALSMLRESDFAALAAATITDESTLLQTLDGLSLHGAFEDPRECHGNSVRCAVELAVLDACCRAWRFPLSAATNWLPETEPFRQNSDTVRYSGVITASSTRKQYLQALAARVFGFRQVKVKVGVPGVDDRRLLTRVRRIVGRRADLRVDANEAWTQQECVARIQDLVPFGITSVEQPIAADAVSHLASIREAVSVPIMLDESLCSLRDGRQAIENSWCDLFNIRLSKCGGFIPSLRLAIMAAQAGLSCQLGCQVGETAILSAAGRHFATSVSGLRYVEGSYDRFLVREPLSRQDLTFGFGGRARKLAGPGLGIEIDESAVSRCSVEQIDWDWET